METDKPRRPGIEISSLSDITRNVDEFKKDDHNVTPHWIINVKSEFEDMSKRGFTITYKEGYFFCKKAFEAFN